MNDSNLLLSHLEQTSFVQQTEEMKKQIQTENYTIATSLLSKNNNEQELHTLHEEVTNLQSSLKTKVDELNKLKTKQMEICKPLSKDIVLKKLRKATKDSLKDSDNFVKEWLDCNDDHLGSREVNRFVDEFLEKRILHHVRAAKVERIEQMCHRES